MATGLVTETAGLAPVLGRFGDIFGRRRFILAGNVLAVVGTLVAATGKSVNQVIAGSVLVVSGCRPADSMDMHG